jgi:hypothetical protein
MPHRARSAHSQAGHHRTVKAAVVVAVRVFTRGESAEARTDRAPTEAALERSFQGSSTSGAERDLLEGRRKTRRKHGSIVVVFRFNLGSTMTTPAGHFEPSTAREILAAFFPMHALHTVVRCRAQGTTFELRCACGTGTLKVHEMDIRVKGWIPARVKYALRNVPLDKAA